MKTKNTNLKIIHNKLYINYYINDEKEEKIQKKKISINN